MSEVEVSVLVPVLDEERHLRGAVERMLAQTFTGAVEFLFVDGGSQDGSREILAELAAGDPRIRMLDNPARRTPHALNVGLRAARGYVIVRMDAHTHYPADYLEVGVARLRRGDAVSVSGPQIAVGDETPWSRRAALALQTPLGVGGARFRRSSDEEFEVDTGFTGMWLRSTLVEAGGWDEEWLTDQDCELAFRLAERGGRHVCVPAMAAEYIPRGSLARLRRQYWQYGLHKVKTFQRHPRAMRPSHLLPPALAGTVVAAVAAPRPLRRAARAGLALYAGALGVTAARAAQDGDPADAAALPVVYATMHLAYGFGLFAGMRRYGVPHRAVAGVVRRLATGADVRLAAYEDGIYHRDAAGELTAERAFPIFMSGLAEEVDRLVLLGRLDPVAARSHYALHAGAEFVALPHYESLRRPLQVLRALGGTLARFWRVLGRVDAVWLNGPSPVALAFVPLALARRRRVVLGVRQNTLAYARSRHPGNRAALLAFRLMEGAWRAVGRRVGVTAVGPEIAALYARSRRVHELSVSFVSEADIAAPLERDYAGELRVLSVGRLETEKNPLLLADALAALVEGGGRWRLVVVGEGDLEGALRARLAELGVDDHAELLGYVPLDRGLFDVYRDAHVFLHVSWTEGLPQVLLEAFAARLPVVATAVGGVGAVADGAAVLIEPGDPAAAADAVRRLAEDAALRERLVEAGVERVRARTTEAERRRLVEFIRG